MQDGIWQAIQDPNLLKNKAFKETLQRKAKEENWLNEPHKRAREKFQQIDEISVKPRTSVQFLKHLFERQFFHIITHLFFTTAIFSHLKKLLFFYTTMILLIIMAQYL